MLKSLIIDDEENGRRNLHHLLAKHCPDIAVIATVSSGFQALELLKTEEPDVIFLDIEMPQMDGFQFLNQAKEYDFMVVIVSAYDQYGIQAIKASAVDYLLKPISIVDLKQTSNRLVKLYQIREKSIKADQNYKRSIGHLVNDLQKKERPRKLTLSHTNGFTIVDVEDIVRVEADNNYTIVILSKPEKQIWSKPLKYFEELLDGDQYIRVHKSHIINLKYLKEFSRNNGGSAIMQDGTTITISRRRFKSFIDKVNAFSV